MKVTLNRSDADLACSLDTACGEVRLENCNAHIHRSRGNKHLGNVNLVVLELLADNVHTREKSLVKYLFGIAALCNCLLDHFFYELGFTSLKVFGNFA